MIQGGVAGYQPLDTFPLVGRDFLPFIDEEANKFAKLINQARYSKDAMSFIKPEIEDAYGNDAADILETIADQEVFGWIEGNNRYGKPVKRTYMLIPN